MQNFKFSAVESSVFHACRWALCWFL